MFTSKHRPNSDFEIAKCPVCAAVFGRREKAQIYKAHCAECKATFWWKPGADKPNVVMDSFKPHRGYCGPSGCICRD